MLLGFETSDDAAVWKMADDMAAVLTVDFFTPIVDDPYEFGRIAAANALSDVFAMGARPHMALNLLALDCKLGPAVAADILRGGADAVVAARAHAATDVTGFGLAGHLHEMLAASGCAAELAFDRIPLFDGAWEHACAYCRPARTFTLMELAAGYVEQGALGDEEFDDRLAVLCDPQTSGGILAAVAPGAADAFERTFEKRSGRRPARIGAVRAGAPGAIALAS